MCFGSLDQEESDGRSSGSSFRYRGTRIGSSPSTGGMEGMEAAGEELSVASAEVPRPGLLGLVSGIFGLHRKEK